MVIDFALARERGEGPRLRPIMMTTMAAQFGTFPIAIGWGASSEGRKPLGLAVVVGLWCLRR
jgi:multidrug efflux pump subunit AcrB